MSPTDQQTIEDKVREMMKQQIQSDKRRDDHRQVCPSSFARASGGYSGSPHNLSQQAPQPLAEAVVAVAEI